MDLSQYQPYILVGVPALTSVIVSGLLTPYLTEKARAKDRSLEKLKLRTELQKAQYPEKMKVSALISNAAVAFETAASEYLYARQALDKHIFGDEKPHTREESNIRQSEFTANLKALTEEDRKMPGADVVNTKNRVLQMESQIATLSSTDTRDADEVLKSIILEWKTIKPLLETTLKRSADYRDLLEAAVFTSNLHIEAGNVLLTLITANRWLMGDEVYTAANSVYSSIERWVLGKGETNDRMQEIVGRMKSLSDVLGMKMHQSELESLPN